MSLLERLASPQLSRWACWDHAVFFVTGRVSRRVLEERQLQIWALDQLRESRRTLVFDDNNSKGTR